jgi:hypothetical protein
VPVASVAHAESVTSAQPANQPSAIRIT